MIMQGGEVDILNKQIAGEYVTIDGNVMFRLVWSESIFENRYGTFREFTESGLFVREVTETRRVRKYNYIHNRWIFEAWAPGNLTASRELPDATGGDYVPVYVFEDRGGNYLPPNEKVVRFLIAAFYGRVQKDEVPSAEYLEKREIERTVESMDDHPAWFQTRPGPARNAIWYAGGVPKWHQRRSTFDAENFVDENFLRKIEVNAREKAREDVARRKELERRQKIDAEVAAQQEYEREVRRETERVQELERERQFVECQEPTPVQEPVISNSPMHRR